MNNTNMYSLNVCRQKAQYDSTPVDESSRRNLLETNKVGCSVQTSFFNSVSVPGTCGSPSMYAGWKYGMLPAVLFPAKPAWEIRKMAMPSANELQTNMTYRKECCFRLLCLRVCLVQYWVGRGCRYLWFHSKGSRAS